MSHKTSPKKTTTMKSTTNVCPVCGFDKLVESPRNRTGGASFEICSCCGFQFGVTDDDQGISYDDHRQQWIANGMAWTSTGKKPAKGWNPQTQLGNLARSITLKRVRGRPPRMMLLSA